MNFTLNKLAVSFDDFSASLTEYNSTPEGAVAACILALKILAGNNEEGEMAIMLLNPETSQGTIRLAGRQLEKSPWIINSYFNGSSPDNGYKIDEPAVISMSTNPYSGSSEEGSLKLFVDCSGSDSPRPVTTKRNDDGTWYASEWSSLIVGIREPFDESH